MRSFRFLAAALTAALLALPATAGNGAPEPGSLLLFPVIDHSTGAGFTAVTVTNTNADFTPVGFGFAGTVDVEFVYINGDPIGNFYCGEANRTRRLTPNDTITVASNIDNPNFPRGYLYVFAKNPFSGQAIAWNWLIGSAFQAAPSDAYEMTPYTFRAGRALSQGAPTDFAPANGIRDLNGAEYERVCDKIMVPHFFGEKANRATHLVLINLSGASQFFAIVNFLIYNDNEEVFSAQYQFRCWAKVRLQNINGAFLDSTLLASNNNSTETVGSSESGWYRINGGVAYSTADSINDPAILAAQITSWNGYSGAIIPYMKDQNPTHGELISTGIFHD